MKVLITGATGTIGSALIQLLSAKGIQIHVLSRNIQSIKGVQCFLWDVEKFTIDEKCIEGVDIIIHLAGKNIAEGNWSVQNQKEIIDSRVRSTKLLQHLMQQTQHNVKKFISASGVGYYGGDNGSKLLKEEDLPGEDFLGKCCVLWEQSVNELAIDQGVKCCILRTGVVLTLKGGALPKLIQPIKLFAGVSLGSGKQMLPWVHIDDVVNAYLFALQSTVEGVFNLNAPKCVDFKNFSKKTATILHRPLWPISIPQFFLQMILGKKSILVTGSTLTSAAKLKTVGFQFKYESIDDALRDLLI